MMALPVVCAFTLALPALWFIMFVNSNEYAVLKNCFPMHTPSNRKVRLQKNTVSITGVQTKVIDLQNYIAPISNILNTTSLFRL